MTQTARTRSVRAIFFLLLAQIQTQNLYIYDPFWDNFVDLFLTTFWSPFGIHFGTHFGIKSAQQDPRWPQKDHQILQGPKKQHFQKPRKTIGFIKILRPGASQDRLKKPKTATKKHPKNVKTGIKRDPKITPKITNFEPILGFKMGCKMDPKTEQKRNHTLNHTISLLMRTTYFKSVFWEHFWSLLIPILEPYVNTKFAQEAA